MKIDEIYQNTNLISNSGESAANRKAEEQNKPAQEPEKSGQSETKVNFSETSVEFSKVAEMMEKVPPERAEKINELKDKIIDGTYSVDSTKIAEKVLEDMLANLV